MHSQALPLRLWLGACAVVAVLGSAQAAQDPNVAVTVTAVPTQVTLSRDATATTAQLDIYASDLVTLRNSTTNDLNRVVFSGTMSVVGASAAISIDSVVQVSGQNPNCTISGASVSCAVSQLKPGATTTFAVVAKAPTAGTRIDFAWSFSGLEGKSTTGNGCCTQSATTSTTLVDPLSGTGLSQVKSFVKPTGGKVFTGATTVPSGPDPFTTLVNLPALPTGTSFATATVLESPAGALNCNNFSTCYQSDITVPGVEYAFPEHLTVVLRADASIIKNGTNILSVVIQYSSSTVPPTILSDCPAAGVPRSDGIPCIDKRVAYKNRLVPGWTADLDGDFEWTIINLKNGSIKIQ